MTTASHNITDDGKTVTIHGLEVFMAHDPRIDGDHDDELSKFDNMRVRSIVENTIQHMKRGSYPRLVVMHEKDGDEPKSSVGRFTRLGYEERDGVGYIVGDCEVEKPVFDKLLATNAFPRRSAEIWSEQNHLSEVALLGRETPRRPLPDTHFTRKGTLVRFNRALRFDMGTVGGGLSTFVPGTKDTHMADDYRKEIDMLKASMDEMKSMMKKHFGVEDEDKMEAEQKEGCKEEMEASDMLTEQFEQESGEVHIDIGSHDVEGEEEEEDAMFPASRRGSADTFSLRRENARMAREIASMKAEFAREKFSKELDIMEAEGYRVPAAQRPRLIAALQGAKDPVEMLESWRDLFARDPMNVRIDMSRAAVPAGDINGSDVAALVREFAGKPEEFKKAINSRINKR
jgi:hypothetical protein